MDLNIGLFQEKSTPPQRKTCWKISWEGWGGSNSSGNSYGRRGSEPKNTSLGVIFNFINVSIASIEKFSFKLETSYHIYFKFPSIGLPLLLLSAFVDATCDNLKLLFIQNISPFLIGKTTRIIHHNQLLLTKFGKNFVILNQWHQNDINSAALLHALLHGTVDCENLGTRLSFFW